MRVFKHRSFGGCEADAVRHINAGGSEGGIVAVSAKLADDAIIHTGAEVGPGASIGYGASIGDGE